MSTTDDYNAVTAEKNMLEQQLEAERKAVTALAAKLDISNKNTKDLSAQLNNAYSQLEAAKEAAKNPHHDGLNARIEDLTNTLESKSKELESVKQDNSKLHQTLEQATKENKQMVAKCDQLEKQVKAAETEKDHSKSLTLDLEAARAQVRQCNEKLDTAVKERDAKASELVSAKTELTDLHQKLLTESNKSCPTEAEVKRRDEIIDSLRKELAAYKSPKKTEEKPPVSLSKFQSAVSLAKNSNKLVLVVVRQNKCEVCDRFEANVLHKDITQRILSSDYVVCELNQDKDEMPFTVSRTPTVRTYFPTSGNWGTAFIPSTNMQGFLNQIYELSNGQRGKSYTDY
jgi:chromosome segregation ATPase